jgi:hypothetical protein
VDGSGDDVADGLHVPSRASPVRRKPSAGMAAGSTVLVSIRREKNPMPTVAAAVLRVDKKLFDADATHRLEEFGMAVDQVSSLLKRMAGGAGVYLLVAPEYYFNPRGTIGKHYKQDGPLAVDRSEKHDIYKGLKKISSRAGKLVIVAGSIMYTKTTSSGTQGLNVCPVLQNGRFLTKNYKAQDDGYLAKGPVDATYTSKASDPCFTVNGVSFGIEVCMDHASKTLKNFLNGGTVDVHILVSDGVTPDNFRIAAKANGHVIHCDLSGSQKAAVRVYTTTQGVWNIDSPTLIEPCGCSNPQINGVETEIFTFNA